MTCPRHNPASTSRSTRGLCLYFPSDYLLDLNYGALFATAGYLPQLASIVVTVKSLEVMLRFLSLNHPPSYITYRFACQRHKNLSFPLQDSALQLSMPLRRQYHFRNLEKRIEVISLAAKLTHNSNPIKSVQLSDLGNLLRELFECLGLFSDLDAAIEVLTNAVELTHEGDPEMSVRLSDLSNALRRGSRGFEPLRETIRDLWNRELPIRFVSGMFETLTETPTPFKGTYDVPLTPPRLRTSDTSRMERSRMDSDASIRSSNSENNTDLSNPERPQSLGPSSELTTRIASKRVTPQVLPQDPDAHPYETTAALEFAVRRGSSVFQAAHLYSLGMAFLSRYRQERDKQDSLDLDEALAALTHAVELTDDSHPAKPARINGLCGALGERFQRSGDFADLDEAIKLLTSSVELTHDDHPDRPVQLHILGRALLSRFNRIEHDEDLKRATKYLLRCSKLTKSRNVSKLYPAASATREKTPYRFVDSTSDKDYEHYVWEILELTDRQITLTGMSMYALELMYRILWVIVQVIPFWNMTISSLNS
jgi:tetratricopeptide (TPR) repeat protein